MTLLEKLIEKRSSREKILVDIFRSKSDLSDGKPIIRNSIVRGDSGQHHLMRKGSTSENVRRVGKMTEGKSGISVRRLLGLFGTDD